LRISVVLRSGLPRAFTTEMRRRNARACDALSPALHCGGACRRGVTSAGFVPRGCVARRVGGQARAAGQAGNAPVPCGAAERQLGSEPDRKIVSGARRCCGFP
ncbi:hypothetical protein ACMZ49_21535, partial [Alcaligenes phenolicus]